MAVSLSYHWRSLLARATTTTLTVLVIAAVVGTLGWMLAFAVTLRHSLSLACDDRKLIVIGRGATLETTSCAARGGLQQAEPAH